MSFQPFTHAEVVAILRQSEKATVDGKHTGHAGERHVSIDNTDLNERLTGKMDLTDEQRKKAREKRKAQKGGGFALFTSFLNLNDQANALLAVLTDPTHAAVLDQFVNHARPGGELKIENARTSQATRMRYAIGDGTQLFPCTHYTLWGRKEASRPRGLHVVSVFGTMGEFPK